MISRKHRLLSLLLAAVMVFGQVPTTAFAAEDLPMDLSVGTEQQTSIEETEPEETVPYQVRPASVRFEGGVTIYEPGIVSLPKEDPGVLWTDPAAASDLEPVPAGSYIYEQMDQDQKKIYQAFHTVVVRAVRDHSYGQNVFSETLSSPVTADQIGFIMNAYFQDQPLTGWVWDILRFGAIGMDYSDPASTSTQPFFLALDPNDPENKVTLPDMDMAAFDAGFAELLKAADGLTTDYDKALALHDAVADHVQYERQLQSGPTGLMVQEAYGAVVNGLAVCDGYAKLYQALLQAVGIPSTRIVGPAGSNGHVELHAWNLVQLDGKYYYTDVTWDDPLCPPGQEAYIIYHAFFNLPYKWISVDHTENTTLSVPKDNNMDQLYKNMIVTDGPITSADEAKMISDNIRTTRVGHRKYTEVFNSGKIVQDKHPLTDWWTTPGASKVVQAMNPNGDGRMAATSVGRSMVMIVEDPMIDQNFKGPAVVDAPLAGVGETVYADAAYTLHRNYQSGDKENITDLKLSVSPLGKAAGPVPGIVIENNIVKVSNAAEAGRYLVTAEMTDGKELTKELEVRKEPAELTGASISGGVTSIEIPDKGKPAVKADQPFALTAPYDQYGQPISLGGKKVNWKIAPAVTGVSIDKDGYLTVTDKAQKGKITVRAKVKGAVIAETAVSLEEPAIVLTSLAISGDKVISSPTVDDPAAVVVYRVKGLDQNGDSAALDPSLIQWSVNGKTSLAVQPGAKSAEVTFLTGCTGPITVRVDYDGGRISREYVVTVEKEAAKLHDVRFYKKWKQSELRI